MLGHGEQQLGGCSGKSCEAGTPSPSVCTVRVVFSDLQMDRMSLQWLAAGGEAREGGEQRSCCHTALFRPFLRTAQRAALLSVLLES